MINLSAKNKFIINLFVSLVCLAILLTIWTAGSINLIRAFPVGFDAAYNAQVSSNFAFTGRYEVNYPSNILFFEAITTGATVLLPTAFLFRFFGIDYITIAFFPLVYSLITIVFVFLIFRKITSFVLAPLGTLLIFGIPLLSIVSIALIGEIACLAFILIAVFAASYLRSNDTKNPVWLLLIIGAMLTLSFISKMIAIFFVITFIGMLLAEVFITKNLALRDLIYIILGMFIVLFAHEVFRLSQFDWNFAQSLESFLASFTGQRNQAGELSEFSIVAIQQRFSRIAGETELGAAALLIGIVTMLLSYLGWIFCNIVIRINEKRKFLPSLNSLINTIKMNAFFPDTFVVLAIGLGGASILVFNILFGTPTTMEFRRYLQFHALFYLGILLFSFKIFIFVSKKLLLLKVVKFKRPFLKSNSQFKSKDFGIKTIGTILIFTVSFVMVFSSLNTRNVQNFFLRTRPQETHIIRLAIEDLVEAVNQLPDDAIIYVSGWWQAPEISLFTGRRFYCLSQGLAGYTPFEPGNTFFVVEHFIGDDAFFEWFNSFLHYELVFQSDIINEEIFWLYQTWNYSLRRIELK